MRTHKMIAVVALSLVLSNCAQTRQQSAPADAPASNNAVVSPADRDSQVLRTVLNDLVTYAGEDSPVFSQGKGPTSVWFSPACVQRKITVESLLERHREEAWKTLSGAQHDAATDAAADVVRRIGTVQSFETLSGLDPRLDVRKTDDHAEQQGVSVRDPYNRPVTAWPPGYARDQQIALVRLVIPWSMHHAEGTWLLDRSGGQWVVLLRQFQYYP